MRSLIDLDEGGRKQFIFDQLKTIPEWSDVHALDDFTIEQNKDGLTNIIYKVSKKKNCDDYPILFRIYGAGSNEFLNRAKELEFFSILSRNNFGVKVIKHFPECRLEEWRIGFRSLNDVGCRNPLISRKIAEKLADMHNIPIDDPDFGDYSSLMCSWVHVCEKYISHNTFNELSLEHCYAEISQNVKLIQNVTSDLVYGHQDLLRGNVLINDASDILIVDFEYSCLLPPALDICHHFCEWMTRYDSDSYFIDWSLHPSPEEEQNFISAYLCRRYGRKPTSEEIETLRSTVHRLQCFSFFIWFVWAVMQSLLGADWNSHDYAVSRWHLYKELKQEYYGIESLPIIKE